MFLKRSLCIQLLKLKRKKEPNIKWLFLFCLEDDIEEVASFSYWAIDNITAEQLLSLPNTTGYMNSHNVFEAELDIEKLKGIQEYENEFYKGGISDYIIAE